MHNARAGHTWTRGGTNSLRTGIAFVSLAAVGVIGLLARPSELWLAAAVVAAMLWGLLPQAIDALFGRWHVPLPAPSSSGSVTLAIHIKDEPDEISRASVVAALASAPTVVVTTSERVVSSLNSTSVPVFIGATIEEAVNLAAITIETDAILIISARSFANVPAAQTAAGMIRDGSSWIIGGCYTFNDDGFAPMVRERLRHRLRSSARSAGLELWEPNSTVVSTALVRDQPFEVGRPWGSTMRSWAATGARGSEYDLTLAMSAEPTNVGSYWPMSIRRRRGAVADVSDALRSERGRHRWLAFGLLLRELIGYPLTLALMTPWLLTNANEFPFRCPLWAVLLLWLPPTVLSWYAERRAYGIHARPLEDALALAFDAPASVLALPAAISCRVTPTRVPVPGRPLMVVAFGFAAITLVPLLTRGTTTERAPAVGLALTELALLWLLAMRAVFQRNWAHRTYRIRSQLPIEFDHVRATTFDISPTGLSFEAPGGNQLRFDTRASLTISLDDGTTLRATCTPLNRRLRGDLAVTGVQLHVDAADEGRWIAQLSRAAMRARTNRTTSVAPRAERAPWAARIAIASTIAVTAVVIAAVAVTVVGYRPLIVRSGSMRPALEVGDVVFVEQVEAGQLAVGDVATIDVKGDETLTHRVLTIVRDGTTVIITTRGDANPTSETFTLSEHALTGRVAGHIPRIGSFIAWTGSPIARRGAVAGVVAYLAIAFGIRLRRRVQADHLLPEHR